MRLEKIKEIRPIYRFLIVGGCSTAIDFIIYMLLSMWINISIAKAISMIVASIFSYFANKLFVFKDKNKTDVKYLLRYYIAFFCNLLTNTGVNYFVFYLSERKHIAFIVATFCGMLVNFLLQRYFVFRYK